MDCIDGEDDRAIASDTKDPSELMWANPGLSLLILVLFRSIFNQKLKKALMFCLGFKPREAKWQAQTDPLSYGYLNIFQLVRHLDGLRCLLFAIYLRLPMSRITQVQTSSAKSELRDVLTAAVPRCCWLSKSQGVVFTTEVQM